jgi:hypothetical protein
MKSSNNINAGYVTSALDWKESLKDMYSLLMNSKSDMGIFTNCKNFNFKNHKKMLMTSLSSNIATLQKTFDLNENVSTYSICA